MQHQFSNSSEQSIYTLSQSLSHSSLLHIGAKSAIPWLQELQHAVAGLRQGVADVQGMLDTKRWHEYLGAVLQEPLRRYSHVQESSDSFVEVPTMGLPDRLIRRGSKCLSKGKETQVGSSQCLCCGSTSAQYTISAFHSSVLLKQFTAETAPIVLST